MAHFMDKQDKKKFNSPEQRSSVHSVNKENNTTFLLKESSMLNENNCVQK